MFEKYRMQKQRKSVRKKEFKPRRKAKRPESTMYTGKVLFHIIRLVKKVHRHAIWDSRVNKQSNPPKKKPTHPTRTRTTTTTPNNIQNPTQQQQQQKTVTIVIVRATGSPKTNDGVSLLCTYPIFMRLVPVSHYSFRSDGEFLRLPCDSRMFHAETAM